MFPVTKRVLLLQRISVSGKCANVKRTPTTLLGRWRLRACPHARTFVLFGAHDLDDEAPRGSDALTGKSKDSIPANRMIWVPIRWPAAITVGFGKIQLDINGEWRQPKSANARFALVFFFGHGPWHGLEAFPKGAITPPPEVRPAKGWSKTIPEHHQFDRSVGPGNERPTSGGR